MGYPQFFSVQVNVIREKFILKNVFRKCKVNAIERVPQKCIQCTDRITGEKKCKLFSPIRRKCIYELAIIYH